jgi:thiol:disulfide interchange protein
VTCKINEAVALNIKQTKKFFDKHNIVALKANKAESDEVLEQLVELGNSEQAIPFYAIYAPGMDQPITAGGPILPGWVIDSLEMAIGNRSETADARNTASTEVRFSAN